MFVLTATTACIICIATSQPMHTHTLYAHTWSNCPQAAAGMGVYGPRTVFCIALKDAPGCHEFLLQDDGKWVHVKETFEIGTVLGRHMHTHAKTHQGTTTHH